MSDPAQPASQADENAPRSEAIGEHAATGTSPATANAASEIPNWRTYRRLWLPDLIAILAGMLVTLIVFETGSLDIAAQAPLYHPELTNPWPLATGIPWRWFYHYAPPLVIGIALSAFTVLAVGAFRPAWRRWRWHSLFVILTLALGPGLVVNAIFKDNWGRPRPRHLEQFGGRSDYVKQFRIGERGKGKSFPCGHSSVGFALIVGYFLWRRRQRALGIAALLASLALGGAMGYGRMLAGAHFFSDVLWSAWMVGLVAWALYFPILNLPGREDAGLRPGASRARDIRWLVATGLLTLGLIAGSLVATPQYEDFSFVSDPFDAQHPPAVVRLDCTIANLDVIIVETGRFQLEGTARGFGLIKSKVREGLVIKDRDGARVYAFHLRHEGVFSELNTNVLAVIPRQRLERLAITLAEGELRLFAPPELRDRIELNVSSGTIILPPDWAESPPNNAGQSELRFETHPQPPIPTL